MAAYRRTRSRRHGRPCANWAWTTTFKRAGEFEPRRRETGLFRAASDNPPELPPERLAKVKP